MSQQHDQPIEPEGNPAVRRRAKFERIEQEPELCLRLLLVDAEQIENAQLDIAPMVPDTPAADFAAVEHHVVGLRPYFERFRIQEGQILVHWRGERVVHEDIPLLFRRIVQQGELGDPDGLPSRGIDQLQLLTE